LRRAGDDGDDSIADRRQQKAIDGGSVSCAHRHRIIYQSITACAAAASAAAAATVAKKTKAARRSDAGARHPDDDAA